MALEAEEQEHVVCVVGATGLQPMSETPILVNTYASVIVRIDLYTPLGQQFPSMVACKIMDVIPGRFFCILIANALSSVINLAKSQRAAITCPLPFEVIHNKKDETSLYSVS